VLHEYQLVKVPLSLPDVDAAAFAVGAQTAYALARRAAAAGARRALVLSASSNTSLYAIQALANRGIEVAAATTRPATAPRLHDLGAREVLCRDAVQADRYDCVIDPYFDLHLPWALTCLTPGGSYFSCGLAAQFDPPARERARARPMPLGDVLGLATVRNVAIVGHCLGRRADLDAALADYQAGRLRVPVDSTFAGDDVAPFLERTYAASDRFGKVVYHHPT
jgi:NADPH:quinone reductase-like Zn-dependent oxidoreductase